MRCSRTWLSGLALTAALGVGPALAAGFSGPFTSASIKLPTDPKTFAGPGAEAINRKCLFCHSADFVLAQPALTPAAWSAEIAKMKTVYKAQIADEDVQPILDYLTRLNSTAR